MKFIYFKKVIKVQISFKFIKIKNYVKLFKKKPIKYSLF